jgi:hypothetical protein
MAADLEANLPLSPNLGASVRDFLEIRNRLVHGNEATDDEVLRGIDIGLTILRAVILSYDAQRLPERPTSKLGVEFETGDLRVMDSKTRYRSDRAGLEIRGRIRWPKSRRRLIGAAAFSVWGGRTSGAPQDREGVVGREIVVANARSSSRRACFAFAYSKASRPTTSGLLARLAARAGLKREPKLMAREVAVLMSTDGRRQPPFSGGIDGGLDGFYKFIFL